jgi:RNA recognition motif-containing protein
LRTFFASYGTVTSSKALGSWGIVQFSSEAEANQSLDANEKDLNGRAIKVEKLRNAPRKRTKKPKTGAPKKERAPKADKPAREPAPRRFVIQFTASTTADFKQLKELFSGYGEIQSLEFRKWDSEGKGSVIYETEAEADAAFAEVNGIDFKGAPIKLNRVKPRKPTDRRKGSKKPKEAKEPKEKAEGTGEAKKNRRRRPRKSKTAKEPKEPREPKEKKPREPRVKKTPPVRDVADAECHLFVGNLAYKVEDKDLQELFSSYHVVEAKVAQGRNERSRGFGSVEVKSKADAAKAIADLNQSQFHERALIVRLDSFVKSA